MLLFLVLVHGQWEIEPIPEQTLKIGFTGSISAPRSLYFSYIWFDLSNVILGVALRQDYRECKFFFSVLPTLSHCLKNLSEKMFAT